MKKTELISAHEVAGPPLWLQVAQLCMETGGPVSRNAIARFFDIPPRQAADIMLYITRRRNDVVRAHRKVTVRAGGIREATLQVFSIQVALLPERGGASHRAPRQQRRGDPVPDSLRDLALGRRRPGVGE